jgi:PAS domain S-box-containing protein
MECELKVDHHVGRIVLYTRDESEKRAQAVKQESRNLLEAVANEVNKIIKQKESEEKVKTQWKYYRALKDNSPEGIVTLDQDRKVVDINQAFKKIFGYSLDSIKGKHLDNFILPKRLKEEGQAITEKIKQGQNIFQNSVRKTREDKEIHCSIIGAPINIDSQHVDYFLIYRDITREKKLEVQLMQTNKMEAIGQLAAGIAHEINTPTQYVNSNIEFFTEIFPDVLALIKEYEKFYPFIKESYNDQKEIEELKKITDNVDIAFLKNEVKEALQDSLDGLNKISNIVDAMRTFSHPGTKDKQEINVNKLIQKTITVTRNEWKYDAELKTNLEDNLEPIPIHQDQISQVMLNLIVNATHAIQSAYEGQKNEKGLIEITSCSKEEYVELRISDDGTGIPQNIRDKIFNPFFTTKDVGEGTGQGLSMAYNVIVENHRGNIYFDTEPGKGTTFIIELPRKRKIE